MDNNTKIIKEIIVNDDVAKYMVEFYFNNNREYGNIEYDDNFKSNFYTHQPILHEKTNEYLNSHITNDDLLEFMNTMNKMVIPVFAFISDCLIGDPILLELRQTTLDEPLKMEDFNIINRTYAFQYDDSLKIIMDI